MDKFSVRDVKARLSTVIDQAQRGRPSIITRDGNPVAVVLGFEEWQRLSTLPSFGDLLTEAPLDPEDVSERRSEMREIDF